MKKYPLVLVEWEDSATHCCWNPVDECREMTTAKCQTVGWIVHKNKERVVLTSSLNKEPDVHRNCDHRTMIPRGCVKVIRRLE